MVRVSAPNAHARDRILSRYLPLVRDALEEIGAAHVNFVVEVQVAEPELLAPNEERDGERGNQYFHSAFLLAMGVPGTDPHLSSRWYGRSQQ